MMHSLALLAFGISAGNQGPSPAEGWFPFVIPWDDAAAGSATDMSGLNAKPAGINGFIRANGSRLVESKTGKPIKFLGTNVAAEAAFPTRSDADRIAAHMAKLGINVVRFHHLNNGWGTGQGGSVWKAGRNYLELDPAMLDRMDYFVFALKQNGIYSNINLQTSRNYLPEMGFPESVTQLKDFAKKVDKFDTRMIALQQEYARGLLDRVNPYTKLKYANDPAVMVVEINNENSLLGWPGESPGAGLDGLPAPFREELIGQWNAWLSRKYGSDDKLRQAWMGQNSLAGPSLLTRANQWTHENQGGGDVTYTQLPYTGTESTAPSMRIEVRRNDGPAWHMQAHLGGLDLVDGKTYTVQFRAKGDRPMSVGIDSRLDQPDWRFLGLGGTIQVGTDWKPYALTFRATGTESGHGRVGFVVGDVRGTVEVADMQIREGVVSPPMAADERLSAKNVSLPDVGISPQYRDYVRFLTDTEVAYGEQMRTFLADELGFKHALILDSQVAWGGLTSLVREADSGYADNHAYWNHPNFLGGDWDPKNYRVDRSALVNALATSGGTMRDLATYQMAGKPYSVSEYNHPAPSDFQSEMMPIAGAFGAYQDWDLLYTFAWDATGAERDNTYYRNYFDVATNPAKQAFFPAVAAMLRSGAIAPAARVARLTIPESDVYSGQNQGAAWSEFLKSAPILKTVLEIQTGRVTKPELAITEGRSGDSSLNVIEGNGGKIFTALSGPTRVICGFVGGTTNELGGIRFSFRPFGQQFAACTLTPAPGDTPKGYRRMLLTVAGRVENPGMVWNADRTSVGDQWGTGPVMAEYVPLTLAFPATATPKAWSLDPSGGRRTELAVEMRNGIATIPFPAASASMWYEILLPSDDRLR